MTNPHVTEANQLALKLILSGDPDDNELAYLSALKSTDDPHGRLAIALHTSRILAANIREAADAAGELDNVLRNVETALCALMDGDPT